MKEAYKKAYELNKLDCRAPFRIGMILLSDRDPHAITYLETAKELYPMDPNVLSWLSVRTPTSIRILIIQRDVLKKQKIFSTSIGYNFYK